VKAVVLVTVPGDATIHGWLDDEGAEQGWRGTMLEEALLEVVRALDGPSRIAQVLLPSSPLLTPLVSVALADGRERFNPEDIVDRRSRRAEFLFYVDGEARSRERPVSRSVGVGMVAPVLLGELLATHPPSTVVALGWPGADLLGALPDGCDLLVFDRLVPPAERTDWPFRKVTLLGADLPDFGGAEEDASFLRFEDALEPFTPYGLLVQQALDQWLDDEREFYDGEAS
jgi:hypothetical protein